MKSAKIAAWAPNAFMDERIFTPLALAFWESTAVSGDDRPANPTLLSPLPGGVPLFLQRSKP